MPNEPVKLLLDDEGKPRVFKMKQIPGHMDLEIQQRFTSFLAGGVQAPDWPKIWVARFNATTVEMREDGVSELPMNLERVSALPPAIYNRLQAEYMAIHTLAMAPNFLDGGAKQAKES